jgi:hypothetical protein
VVSFGFFVGLILSAALWSRDWLTLKEGESAKDISWVGLTVLILYMPIV